MYNGMFAQAFGAKFWSLKKVCLFSGVPRFHSSLPADITYMIKFQVVAKQILLESFKYRVRKNSLPIPFFSSFFYKVNQYLIGNAPLYEQKFL